MRLFIHSIDKFNPLLTKDADEYWIESAPNFGEASFSAVWTATTARSNEISKICIPLRRSDLKFQQKTVQLHCEIEYSIFNIFALVQSDFAIFRWIFHEILSEFRDKFQKIMKIIDIDEKCEKLREIPVRELLEKLIEIFTNSFASLLLTSRHDRLPAEPRHRDRALLADATQQNCADGTLLLDRSDEYTGVDRCTPGK